MALLGHLDRWSCVLKSLPQVQVQPHPWKECPQTIHEELPHGPRQPQGINTHRTPEGIGVCLPLGREVRRKLRISRWTRYSLPRQHSLRPFWCNCGTLEQFVPASVLSKRVPCKGRECFSIKKVCLARFRSRSKLRWLRHLRTVGSVTGPYFFAIIANWLSAGESVTGPCFWPSGCNLQVSLGGISTTLPSDPREGSLPFKFCLGPAPPPLGGSATIHFIS